MDQKRVIETKNFITSTLGDGRKFCEICVKDYTFTSKAFQLLTLEEQQQIVEGIEREIKDTWFFNFQYRTTLQYCFRFASRVFN